MTKHFCDLCGKLAEDCYPSLRVDFPDQAWIGSRSLPGSIGPTDGSWTPHIDARIVFDAHEFKNSVRPHNPDLCAACVAHLLRKMASAIELSADSRNMRATAQQAAEGFQKMREAAK